MSVDDLFIFVAPQGGAMFFSLYLSAVEIKRKKKMTL